MAKSSNSLHMMLLLIIVLCGATLLPSGSSQEPPPPPPLTQDIEKCWSSLTSIPSCLTEIVSSLLIGQIGKIGPVCCSAINQISDSCWPKMFPYTPYFGPLLKNSCPAAPPPRPPPLTAGGNNAIALPNGAEEIIECWSTIKSKEGCALEVYKSLTNGNFTGIGTACCKAVIEINDKCWPKMFPFNPFFPPLLKNFCVKLVGAAPSPTPV